jgi:tetratricopeptide (TPR) repeat protein
MAQQVDNLSAVAWVSLLSGVYYAGVGDWGQASTLLRQVIEIAERLGDHSRWADGLSNLAMIPYFQGHLTQSNKLFDDLAAAAFRRKDAHNEAWALRGQVYCFLPRGKFMEALVCLETLRVLLHDNPHVVDEALNIDLHALSTIVQFQAGDKEAALESADKALKLIEQTPPTSYLSLPGYAGLADTYLTLWEQELISSSVSGNPKSRHRHASEIPPQARERNPKSKARRACKALRKYARVFPIGQPRAYLHQGRFEWLSGRPHLARDLWRQALEAANRLNVPYSQGLAHYELGRHLPVDDPRRLEHLLQAYEILMRLEATYDVERVQAELP